MAQDTPPRRFSLFKELSDFWLWLGPRSVPIGVSLIAITVWLCIDFSVTYRIPASPFSSSMLSILPGLLAAVTITGGIILALAVAPAVALRIPLNKGEPALIDLPDLNRSLSGKPGMVTMLERRWIAIILIQFIGMPLVDLAWALLPHVTNVILVPSGIATLVVNIYGCYWLLVRGIEIKRSYEFSLFAAGAIAAQFFIGYAAGHAVVVRWFTSSTETAMQSTMLFMFAVAWLFGVQALAARKLRRHILRPGILKTAFAYTHIALLVVAIVVPIGGEVVAIPMRLAGLHGYKCVVYTVDETSPAAVQPGLLSGTDKTTPPINFATPPLDGFRYVKLKADPERKTFRIKDAAIVDTQACTETTARG